MIIMTADGPACLPIACRETDTGTHLSEQSKGIAIYNSVRPSV